MDMHRQAEGRMSGAGSVCFHLKTHVLPGPGGTSRLEPCAACPSPRLTCPSVAVTCSADGRLVAPLPGLYPDWLSRVLAVPEPSHLC